MKINAKIKIKVFIVILLLVISRIVFYSYFKDRIDDTSLTLIIVAILTLFIPFENIKSFKAAGVELTLDREDIKSSINSIHVKDLKGTNATQKLVPEQEKSKLKSTLKLNENNLKFLLNSRILWIDDNQKKIIGERRLLRTLGANIVTVISSDSAKDILLYDGDFDLIISDIQRIGEYFKLNDGIEIHDGVNFIEYAVKNKLISSDIPVIFYAAYDYERLIKFTERVRILRKEIISVNNIADLFRETVNMISQIKNMGTRLEEEKTPTPVG